MAWYVFFYSWSLGWEVKGYGYRWLVELAFSSIKKTNGRTHNIKENG